MMSVLCLPSPPLIRVDLTRIKVPTLFSFCLTKSTFPKRQSPTRPTVQLKRIKKIQHPLSYQPGESFQNSVLRLQHYSICRYAEKQCTKTKKSSLNRGPAYFSNKSPAVRGRSWGETDPARVRLFRPSELQMGMWWRRYTKLKVSGKLQIKLPELSAGIETKTSQLW